jgi:hypothetical protein
MGGRGGASVSTAEYGAYRTRETFEFVAFFGQRLAFFGQRFPFFGRPPVALVSFVLCLGRSIRFEP